MRPTTTPGILLLATALLSGCSGSSGSGSTTSGATTADLLLGDAPRDDLLTFQAEIASVRLERADGGLSDELLAEPVTTELLGLQGRMEWLASARPAVGDYVAVHVRFTPSSYQAVAEDGGPVTIHATSDELVATLAAPQHVDRNQYNRFEIDLSLLDSLQGDVSTGMLTFDPQGEASASDGTAPLAFDRVVGVVRLADSSTGNLDVDAYLDDGLSRPFARLRTHVDPLTLLLTESQTVYVTPKAFLDDLVLRKSVVEIHGSVGPGGEIAPRWIRVRDLSGTVPPGTRVDLAGRVVGLSPGGAFTLRMRQITAGRSVAEPLLAGPFVQVTTDPLTRFVLDAGDVIQGTRLAVGQAVNVAFSDFTIQPFPAALVVVDALEPRFDGTITDVAGLPASAVLHLDAHEPAILAGQVASSATDVTLDLTGSTLALDVPGLPTLQPGMLQTTLAVRVQGTVSGPASGPTLAGTETLVVPGRLLDAQVGSTDEPSSRFTTSGGSLAGSFGGMVSAGPLSVVIQPQASFEGDATSESEFFQLFAGLGAGQSLAVDVQGIGTGVPNEIGAWVLKVRVQ